jgi:hypothetical protein
VVNVVVTMNEVIDGMIDDKLAERVNEPASPDDGPEAVDGGVTIGAVVLEGRVDVELAEDVDELGASEGAVEVEFA